MTNEERELRNYKIIEFAKTHSQKETALEFSMTQAGISAILKKNKIKYNKSRLNLSTLYLDINYFEKIDNVKKAYWLGFIAADGYINKDLTKLTISVKDLEILEKFKKDIESEHTISKIEHLDKRTNKVYLEYSIQITNNLFVKALSKWVNWDKTNNFKFPKIKEEYYSYFIAGLFDGDGSVYLRNNGTSTILCANLISTKEVLQFIQEYLTKFNISIQSYTKVSENKDNVFKVYWYKDTVKVLDFIYQGNSDLYLSRKYSLYKLNRNFKPTRNRVQKVLQYDKLGNFINKYDSLIDAASNVDTTNGPICNAYKKQRSCKNFYWIPYEESNAIFKQIDINQWKQYGKIVEKV